MPDKPNSSLLPYIRDFFKSLTDDKRIIDMAAQIQSKAEQGHSAVQGIEVIEHELISNDGSRGYIVQKDNKTGFRRFFNEEQFIKSNFLNSETIDFNKEKLKAAIRDISAIINPVETKNETDWQWQAAISCLFHRRFILSGGPGTGKTTTIIRMLLLYLRFYKNRNIALAAPTGKAANRMISGIQDVLKSQNINSVQLQGLPDTAHTLHRLLGYKPRTNTNLWNQENHLPYDLIIVDEASMLDTSITTALLQAVKPKTQLILLGDRNQLPAVDVGNVFSDLCSLLDTHPPVCNLYSHILKDEKLNHDAILNYVELKKNYRFKDDSVISKLCDSIINNDTNDFFSCNHKDGFKWENPVILQEKMRLLQKWYEMHNAEKDSLMLLSATNYGDNSVHELNMMSRKILHENYDKNENMPVLITQNDYTLGIYNGDIGSMTQSEGHWYVSINIEGEKQQIPLEAIRNWQMAHAISIHKSQGSEYDHILIAISDKTDKEFLSRELLYTAISRARKSITLWSSEEIISTILNDKTGRITFLN